MEGTRLVAPFTDRQCDLGISKGGEASVARQKAGADEGILKGREAGRCRCLDGVNGKGGRGARRPLRRVEGWGGLRPIPCIEGRGGLHGASRRREASKERRRGAEAGTRRLEGQGGRCRYGALITCTLYNYRGKRFVSMSTSQ
jgi:hypothetical protein